MSHLGWVSSQKMQTALLSARTDVAEDLGKMLDPRNALSVPSLGLCFQVWGRAAREATDALLMVGTAAPLTK